MSSEASGVVDLGAADPSDDKPVKNECQADPDESEGLSEQLEVVFDNHDSHRRKASLTQEKSKPQHDTQDVTSCFVHSLLHNCHKKPDQSDAKSSGTDFSEKWSEVLRDSNDSQSRLLSKRQLADMAYNIRELSKKLGTIRVLLKVRNVFLLTKAHDRKLFAKTREMTKWLLRQKNAQGEPYTVWVEETLEENEIFDSKSITSEDPSFKDRLKYWNNELCRKKPHTFEICLALGGDGTVLYASWLFKRVVPPVMSFAGGSLGFLTKFDFDDHARILERAFKEGITVSLRLRFEATIMRSVKHKDKNTQASRDLIDELTSADEGDVTTHKPDGSHNILNDIVIDRGPNATMSSIELFGDDEHFTTLQADGICVATPTGSTAYNLAAGGSLCHPDNPVILVTAIAPHTLSFRPIILPDTIVLRVGVPYDGRASCWASFDGKERSELCPGDYVTISASRFPFPSVLPLDRRSEDWVESISRTLNWNNRQRQKAFDESNQKEGGDE
ncbi:ATP-NAD kinase [Dissoconium aciculare CBS 342.82]|uniref:ATP-NAD kinase n=1 Tax=Dissoconium aciculare CBS 342.82 TaxID=1314786 RepID=A0A6J3MGA3_9PEZI|nr:ATP-NAD kinase [Dissoconium aciculare CBS 342.82]KAF1826893.1 ATP-NAD kinase [Dissoconium aciculare CBS 342.82]